MNTRPDFDPERDLPPEKKYFSIRFLREMWDCSEKSVQRLIDSGDLRAVDIAPTPSAKAMQRITRESLVVLLNKRKSGLFTRRAKKKSPARRKGRA